MTPDEIQALAQETKRQSTRRALATMGVIALTCSVALSGLVAREIRHGIFAAQSLHWPVVEGFIMSSGVQRIQRNDCAVKVKYRYWVGGRELIGDRATFRPAEGCRNAEALAAQFPPSSNADVHYRPGTPEVSVLQPGGWDLSADVLLGLLGLTAAMMIAVTIFLARVLWGARR